MKIYCGLRDGEDFYVRVSQGAAVDGEAGGSGDEPYLLPGRPDLFGEWLPDFSQGPGSRPPPPFRWAGQGPGTAHLALAIAADVARSADEAAVLLSGMPLLHRLLSHLPPDGFEIAETIIAALLKAGSAEPPAKPRARRRLEAVGR